MLRRISTFETLGLVFCEPPSCEVRLPEIVPVLRFFWNRRWFDEFFELARLR